MANFSIQRNQSERRVYEQKYATSRANLLIVVACTAINIILLVTNADVYFLFSAFIPYFITGMGMLLCGRFPEEYYVDELAGMQFLDNSVFYILLIISIIIIFIYLFAWYMSKNNRVGWLVFILALFTLDTIGMLINNGISFQSIFDILFHIWVMYYLIVGIKAHYKLKEFSAVEQDILDNNVIGQNQEDVDNVEIIDSSEQNSHILRKADMDVKYRVLLETKIFDYNICYRRVKHTNELVINGNVYDEIVGIVEVSHTLSANVDGHHISAGYTGTHSIIIVDNQVVSKKLRLF